MYISKVGNYAMNVNQAMLCIRCCALYICTHLKIIMNISKLVGKVGGRS